MNKATAGTPGEKRSGPRPMGGPPHGMGGGEKAKDFKGAVKRLLQYMGSYKISVSIVLIFAVFSTVFVIIGPKLLGKMTTRLSQGLIGIIMGTGEGIDFTYIGRMSLLLLAFYLVSALFSYVQGFLMTDVAMKITYRLRKDISAKIHRLPFDFYDRTSTGEVLSRITNDVDVIGQSLNQSITQIITSVTTIVGVLIMMLTISWKLTLIALAVLPISMLLMTVIMKNSQKYFSAQQEYLGHINGHVEEMYSNRLVVKAFNGEEDSRHTFDGMNRQLFSSAWKSQFFSGTVMPMMNVIANLGYVAVCILGGYYTINGSVAIGDIQAFIQYMRSFSQPISQVANIANVLQQTAAASERVFAFLEQEEEQPDPEEALQIDREGKGNDELCVSIQGSVQFAHVSFGYLPPKMVIHDFSADIRPGEKVAIVGPTGAGKTTIVKLLMRFYDVNEGAILVDGYNIRDFSRKDLRSLFGMVLQDTWLYNGTIADNIRYGRLDATDDEVMEAAKIAQVDHFVHTLPDGYNMILNEETTNVSQGQKQLLTIARAVLANPQILILDEATSSVDTRTEILIQKAMDNIMQGRTSFIIAHRLSTIRNADRILAMRDGDIVESGTHDELMAKSGFYAQLYNSQFAVVGESNAL